MTNLDLLILEDSDRDFESIHKTSLETYNRVNKTINFIFEGNRAKNVDEALDLLHSDKNFYAAIVDLKLAQEVAMEGKGNELIHTIYKKHRIPIFVYSSNLTLLDEDISSNTSALLRLCSKDKVQFLDILNEIENLFSTGFLEILGGKGLFDDFLNKIFWDHFAINMAKWNTIEGTKDKKEKVLIRYISEHLKEHLELKEGNDRFDHYVPEEVYIFPQIKPFIFTGSILANAEGNFYLVLNPSCDLAQDKTDYVLLSEINPKNSYLKTTIKRNKSLQSLPENDPQKTEALSYIKKLLNNSFSPRYHYLPKASDFEGGLIDFQKVTTVKKKEVNESYKIIGTVTSSFMKDITARFSYYYSRQGSPDFEWADIIKKLLN